MKLDLSEAPKTGFLMARPNYLRQEWGIKGRIRFRFNTFFIAVKL